MWGGSGRQLGRLLGQGQHPRAMTVHLSLRPMPLLSPHTGGEIVSREPGSLPVQPTARAWKIASFQAAAGAVLFQLSIDSAVVFFFLLVFPSSLFGAGDGTQGLVYATHLLSHWAPSPSHLFSTVCHRMPISLPVCIFRQVMCLAQLTFWV